MSVRFGINGVGRIGRALLRVAAGREDLELVAVNDLASAEQLAALIAHDSVHGPYAGTVTAAGPHELLLDGRPIAAHTESDAGRVPWGDSGVAVVVEATGRCLRRAAAERHLGATVARVLVSANTDEMDVTICHGVNSDAYDPARHRLVSGASCTTNCLTPVALVLHREFGLVQGLFNTVHSYNNDQRLLEYPHRDPRRARAAALNLIPTTTSAVAAVGRVLPELEGRLQGFAVRVPTPNVSLVDLVVELEARPTVEELNGAFRVAAAGELATVLGVTDDELVSSDFLRATRSAVVDLPLTQATPDGLCRIVAWYDNEWGHACRLADLVALLERPAPLAGEKETT